MQRYVTGILPALFRGRRHDWPPHLDVGAHRRRRDRLPQAEAVGVRAVGQDQGKPPSQVVLIRRAIGTSAGWIARPAE